MPVDVSLLADLPVFVRSALSCAFNYANAGVLSAFGGHARLAQKETLTAEISFRANFESVCAAVNKFYRARSHGKITWYSDV